MDRANDASHCCALCRIVAAAKHCGELEERGECDADALGDLSSARQLARDGGHSEADVDEATFEGLERARDPAY